jgi:RNA polymerase sigma factor (sigma-70 family)
VEISDYELVKKCLEGNQDSFAELVSRYKKLIYSVVFNLIPDKQDVNDISQEVFIRIYKSLHSYNPEYKFSTWSVKIATNLCIDALRKKKNNSVSMEEVEELSSSGTPEEQYLNKERSEKIRQAVEQLPEKYRIPIVLFHQNGMSYEEIMKILDEPMSIVKNRLYRARLMLREKLLPFRKEDIL